MSHYAKIVGGVVVSVAVIDPEYLATAQGQAHFPGTWVQTSYNTEGGVHRLGGTPMRKNFAGVGYTYDAVRDAFYAPKPFASWTLDESTCHWEAPIARPTTGKWKWDEALGNWVVSA
jgi:hypothetical protein